MTTIPFPFVSFFQYFIVELVFDEVGKICHKSASHGLAIFVQIYV